MQKKLAEQMIIAYLISFIHITPNLDTEVRDSCLSFLVFFFFTVFHDKVAYLAIYQ